MLLPSKWLRLCSAFCFTAAVLLPQQQSAVGPEDLRSSGPESAKQVTTETPAIVKPASPAAPERVADYVLGPDDQIIIHAFQVPEVPATPIQVGGDGYINLPMAARVKASGMTVSALEQELSARFANYVRDPQVTVLVADYRSQPVSVVGEVANPGVVQLKGRKNLVEVIASAGGLRNDAGNVATITRELSQGQIPLPDAADDPTGKFSIAHVRLHDVMEAHNPRDNILIKANDLIMIPKAPLLYVVGAVQRPGGYVLSDRDSVTVLQAVALAGGLTPLAAAKGAKILHQNADLSSRTELPTNVSKILSGQAPDVALHRDDILFVPNSKAKSAGTRALDTALNMAGIAVWRF